MADTLNTRFKSEGQGFESWCRQKIFLSKSLLKITLISLQCKFALVMSDIYDATFTQTKYKH